MRGSNSFATDSTQKHMAELTVCLIWLNSPTFLKLKIAQKPFPVLELHELTNETEPL